jgi:hypothetical protein
MPAIDLSGQGDLAASIPLRWRQIPTARAHFINAFGAKGTDFVIWSSSELPDAGMGLFDYLSNANIERRITDRVLLPATATQCAVPRGNLRRIGWRHGPHDRLWRRVDLRPPAAADRPPDDVGTGVGSPGTGEEHGNDDSGRPVGEIPRFAQRRALVRSTGGGALSAGEIPLISLVS